MLLGVSNTSLLLCSSTGSVTCCFCNRLEERLRLQALAPAEWHTQIYRLTEDQLIGLRFASDDEVVELAKQALEQNLNRKQIKERIKSWRPDDWRV